MQQAVAATTTPKAPCRIQIDRPHESDYLSKRGIKAVKVDAFSICDLPQSEVTLTVTLYKTGYFADHYVNRTSTNPLAETSQGFRVNNYGTYSVCINQKKTTYYGVAFSKALVAGQWLYAGNTFSTKLVTLDCGTKTP
jgi:hypothetical protein